MNEAGEEGKLEARKLLAVCAAESYKHNLIMPPESKSASIFGRRFDLNKNSAFKRERTLLHHRPEFTTAGSAEHTRLPRSFRGIYGMA